MGSKTQKFPPQGIPMFNQRGEHVWCGNEDQVRVARQNGFTSASYVRSNWPKAVYHKVTGVAQSVGKLEWSEEQNRIALKALGPDWSTEFVAAPEPTPEKPLVGSGLTDAAAMLEILAQLKVMNDTIADLETAVADIAAARVSMEARLIEVEGVLTEASATEPEPVPELAGKKK